MTPHRLLLTVYACVCGCSVPIYVYTDGARGACSGCGRSYVATLPVRPATGDEAAPAPQYTHAPKVGEA